MSSLKSVLLSFLCAAACCAAVKVTVTPSVPSGVPVGMTIDWVATASDTADPNAQFLYRVSIGPVNGPLQLRRDFYTYNSFPWTPTDSEGIYKIQVAVRSSTGATGVATSTYTITSRVTAGHPVISRTNHPLVALYSMPACPSGESARVRFKLPQDSTWQATNPKACNGTTSLNFYVAGMRESTTYQLQQEIFQGQLTKAGPVMSFTTGSIPDSDILR